MIHTFIKDKKLLSKYSSLRTSIFQRILSDISWMGWWRRFSNCSRVDDQVSEFVISFGMSCASLGVRGNPFREGTRGSMVGCATASNFRS